MTEPVTIRWQTGSGIELAGSAYGDPTHPGVVLLHGGGQTRHAWGGTGQKLSDASFYAVTLDLRGHGESSWAPDGDYSMDAFVKDLSTLLDDHFDRPPAVVGASIGGLTGLVLEGESEQSRASALVLVDSAPKMEREGVARVLTFMRANPDGFASLGEAANFIATYLPHRKRSKDLSGLSKNLRLGDDGRYRWHWDPRFINRAKKDPTFSYERFSKAAQALTIPTLLVRGRLSDVLSEESADDFKKHAPHAEYVDIANAAHMVAGDRNDLFTNAVVEFLQRTLP